MSMFVSARFVCACLLLAAPPALAGDPPIARALLAPELAALNDEELARIGAMSPLPALPADPTNRVADSLAAAQLGHRLFFDKRLSPKGVSCASCHDPVLAFTDGKPLAQGIATARRNTPTILDAARRRWNGWDGKFDSLWSQALSPLENPVEMGSSRARLLQVVRDDPDLRARYNAIFGDFPSELAAGAHDPLAHELAPVPATVPSTVPSTAPAPATQALIDATTANVLKSLGAYQRKLLSGPAPIDRFVDGLNGKQGGDLDALSPAARRGLATFVSKGGCYQCHRGPSFTDEEFHALGLAGANGRVPDDPARLAAVDFLRANSFNCAGILSDARDSAKANMVKGLRRSSELFGQFRTPSLRGVALTAPYMHDGRFASLDAVAHFYDTLDGASPIGHHGESVLVPLDLGASGRADLVEFLRALGTDVSLGDPWKVNPLVEAARTEPQAVGR